MSKMKTVRSFVFALQPAAIHALVIKIDFMVDLKLL